MAACMTDLPVGNYFYTSGSDGTAPHKQLYALVPSAESDRKRLVTVYRLTD
jgi:hypothetical protein